MIVERRTEEKPRPVPEWAERSEGCIEGKEGENIDKGISKR